VKLLLEKGAELETKSDYGRTPVSWAAGNGHEKEESLEYRKAVSLRRPSFKVFVHGPSVSVDFSGEKEVRMTCLIDLTDEMLSTYNNECAFM
jgi:hypothetical protein